MMSEYYDRYHRWEPLAEFHFRVSSDDESDEELDDDKYFYCLCSRTFIRDAVKTYYVDKEKEEDSESDVEVLRDSQSQEWEDQSHVHFSVDTSYKTNRCEKDEGASCYCSASHTDNYCSTDEHDPAQMHGTASHALQPSDSGADLTYQDCHSDYTNNDRLEQMDQDLPAPNRADFDENYLSEDTWEKFWAINGERLIWASWIKKYSDYINPAYLGDNNELVLDDNSIPKQHSADQIYNIENSDANEKTEDVDESMRERKFSYDSKVNPYKKSNKSQNASDKTSSDNKDDTWLPLARKRSCSEHDRILSPRTILTDSMTNVTKITLSSYDVTSSHVTSESTPTDDYSMSSSTSDDQSNDQTRIANIDENLDQAPSEELDTEQYWQLLWKKHFGDQYALHYANYIESHNVKERQTQADLPTISVVSVPEVTEKVEEKPLEIECENSEGNSQEMPTVIEVQTKVENIKLDDKPTKPRRKNKKNSNRILGSVGVLLQNLLKEEQKKSETNMSTEMVDAGDTTTERTEMEPVDVPETTITMDTQSSLNTSNFLSYDYDDGDDEPPEEVRTISLKRGHEIDDEGASSQKIRATFEKMGFCVNSARMPKGQIIYSKPTAKLRPPHNKKSNLNKKTKSHLSNFEAVHPYMIREPQQQRVPLEDSEVNTEVVWESEKYDPAAISDATNTDVEEFKNECKSTGESDNVEVMPAEVALPDSTDVDTEDSDDMTNEAAPMGIPSTATKEVSPNKSVTKPKQSFKDLIDFSAPAALNRKRVNLPEQDARPKLAPKKKNQQMTPTAPLPEPKTIYTRAFLQDPQYVTDKMVADMRGKRYDCWSVDDNVPPELKDAPKMVKYWRKRHSLFHRFDEGIKLDHESWFSVTPESVAWHIANKFAYDVVLDAFCGAGGNTIQFARTCAKVIAVDIDPLKIELARHNAKVYGVADRIEFIVGDFFELAPTLKADMVFLSPPWGGPQYSQVKNYNLETMLEPRPASELMKTALSISPYVAMYVPRNTTCNQLVNLGRRKNGALEIEQSFIGKRFIALTAYYY
ncbi:trimethylguanosine synthase isoform X2 [Ostrinia nubilalis]|uniref:trimethylguanosine synthase isoform X2 n=1 Tax=Ostrinia nubilalis TaxID=29057 RepID=UPI0030825CC3